MAEADSGQDKTEDPTPRRQEQARERGQVVTSKEVFVAIGIAVGALLVAMAGAAIPHAAEGFAAALRLAPGDPGAQLGPALASAAWQVGLVGAGFGALTLVITVLAQVVVGGLNFAPAAMAPKLERISPAKGLARMVSMRALVELAKAVVKIGLLSVAAGWVLFARLPQLGALWDTHVAGALGVLARISAELLATLAVVLAVIAALDWAWQRFSHSQSLRMTLQEVRDERKDTDGSPEVKGRMRQLQMQAARRAGRERASLRDVGRATAVITNPVHFAVALRYVPGETPAPVIVSMARGPMALDLREAARKAGITRLDLPPLARALYFTGAPGAEIDVRLFAAVATVLAHVHRLDRGLAAEMPDILLPEGLHFDAMGRRERH